MMKDDIEKYDKAVEKTIDHYFKEPMCQAIDDGVTPPILVEALLRTAYTALDLAARENRHNLPWAFRKLADSTASMFEELSE